MNSFLKGLLIAGLTIGSAAAFAGPSVMLTHNKTDVESNAFIDGTIASPYPTRANSDGKVSWMMVKMACYGHTQGNACRALIKMETNTTAPIDLGYVSMDVNSGAITPKKLSANGYTLTVNGPGETTLTKD